MGKKQEWRILGLGLFLLVMAGNTFGLVDGSGTINYVPLWINASNSTYTLGNSALYQTGSHISVGTTRDWGMITVSGANPAAGSMLNLENTGASTGDATYIKFRHYTDGRVQAYIRDAIGYRTAGWNGALIFGTASSTNNAADKMILDDLGNVGIGTMSPSTRLDVSGTTTTTQLRVSNLSGTGNAYACIDANGTIYRSNSTCV